MNRSRKNIAFEIYESFSWTIHDIQNFDYTKLNYTIYNIS